MKPCQVARLKRLSTADSDFQNARLTQSSGHRGYSDGCGHDDSGALGGRIKYLRTMLYNDLYIFVARIGQARSDCKIEAP